MKKKIAPMIISGVLTIIFCYLAFNVFLKIYFNKFYYKIPNFIGVTESAIREIDFDGKINLVVAGKEFSKLPKGTVFRQEPSGNSIVKKGRIINLWVSKGIEDYTMPDFKNKNLMETTVTLQKNGIKIKKLSYTDSSLPYNTVIATTPSAGDDIQKSKGVSLLLSNFTSNSNIEIPDLVGFTLQDAKTELENLGFVVGDIEKKELTDFESNIVIEMKDIGKKVPAGTVIKLVVSKKIIRESE